MITAAIAVLCTGLTGSDIEYQPACSKAFQAVSIQYEIDKAAKKLEKRVETTAKKHVSNEAALAATAAYTILVAREARFSTRKIPGIQSTALIIRAESVTTTLSWSF